MSYKLLIIKKARMMRRKGFSYTEIASVFRISKSTASIWTSNEKVSMKGNLRISDKQNMARKKALTTLANRRISVMKQIDNNARFTLRKINIDRNLSKLLCSIFIWTEGEKGKYNRVGFTNSDPQMVKTFLNLLRKSYPLDEKKLRALVHVHEYHNMKKVLIYWSRITNIPLLQFNKSYLKPHTGKRTRDGYMGSIHISYYDYKVARELASIYNIFANKFRGVG